MYGGCFFSTNKLISVIKKEKPDIVHLHCINGYFVNIYRLITWLKKNKIKTVLTLHAEFMHTANCGYALECENWRNGCGNCPRRRRETKSLFIDNTALSWKKMKKAFDGFGENLIVVSVSQWLMGRAKQSPILEDKTHTVVLNGVNTEIFKRTDTAELRKKLGLNDEKVALFVTSSFSLEPNHIKGGYYVVELAKRLPDVKFVIVGNKNSDNDVCLPENVLNIGRVDGQEELTRYYAMADVTLLPSKKETFSMVTAESLCCGTPVVGFKAGGPETIALEEYSTFVDYADIDAFENALKNELERKCDAFEISQKAKAKYKNSEMTAGYIEVYNRLLGAKIS